MIADSKYNENVGMMNLPTENTENNCGRYCRKGKTFLEFHEPPLAEYNCFNYVSF